MQTLPLHLSRSTTVGLGESFVLVGGYAFAEGDYHYDTIFDYDPVEEVFMLRAEKLSSPRSEVSASMVSTLSFPKCQE